MAAHFHGKGERTNKRNRIKSSFWKVKKGKKSL